MNSSPLGALASYFALLSLFAIGGANTLIPEFHRVAVDAMHWMSDRQFADMFAISRVAPGPNVIIVTLIGYHVAGIVGALVATGAMVCRLAHWLTSLPGSGIASGMRAGASRPRPAWCRWHSG